MKKKIIVCKEHNIDYRISIELKYHLKTLMLFFTLT